MRNRFGEQLERLHVEMIQMGALCEDAISAAAQALMKGDEDLARAAGRRSGRSTRRSREVENLCLKLLLQQQPVAPGPAGDLLCAEDDFRSGTDRGPGGGHRGADPVRASAGRPPGRQRIEEMSKAVIRMVTDSVDSFVKRDLELAREVCREDDQVDDLFNQVKKGADRADRRRRRLRRAVAGSHHGGQVSGADRRSRHQRGGVGGVLHYGESPLQQLSGLRTGAAPILKRGGAMLTYEDVKNNSAVRTYIQRADRVSDRSGLYGAQLCPRDGGGGKRRLYPLHPGVSGAGRWRLAKVAGFLHDIGNLVNRVDHSQSGAVMAFRILDNMDCPPEEIATIVTAIGNHDEGTGMPVNAVAAALILADKSDVRRSRVRNPDMASFDIHDRVNYSVKKSVLKINEEHTLIKLKLSVDTKYGSVMDYFEIFMGPGCSSVERQRRSWACSSS